MNVRGAADEKDQMCIIITDLTAKIMYGHGVIVHTVAELARLIIKRWSAGISQMYCAGKELNQD